MTSKGKLRDRLAVSASNFIINHVASEEYRRKVKVIVRLGMQEWDRILQEDADGNT